MKHVTRMNRSVTSMGRDPLSPLDFFVSLRVGDCIRERENKQLKSDRFKCEIEIAIWTAESRPGTH